MASQQANTEVRGNVSTDPEISGRRQRRPPSMLSSNEFIVGHDIESDSELRSVRPTRKGGRRKQTRPREGATDASGPSGAGRGGEAEANQQAPAGRAADRGEGTVVDSHGSTGNAVDVIAEESNSDIRDGVQNEQAGGSGSSSDSDSSSSSSRGSDTEDDDDNDLLQLDELSDEVNEVKSDVEYVRDNAYAMLEAIIKALPLN